MMNKDEILTNLNSMSELIAAARLGLTQNQLVEMDNIQDRIRTVVESITDLPPEEAMEMRPVLTDLLTEFEHFSNEVEAKIKEIQAASAPGGAMEQPAGE